MEQQKFIETVERIRDRAQSSANKITAEEIKEIFRTEEMELDDDQLRLVYAYLKTSKIEVAGEDAAPDFVEEEDGSASEDGYEDRDMEFVKMYRADIKNVKTLSDDELAEAMKNPEAFRGQIVNTFLKDVIRWVKPYANETVFMSDLIQEGNMGLMEGAAGFDYTNASVKELRAYLKNAVVKAAQAALYEQESENNVGYKIAGRVNAVNDCAKELSEELGRKVTMEELAKKLEMTYEEVKEIVDLSSNKIEYINYL